MAETSCFIGRIHFSVHYPDLDFAARCTIWRMFLAKAVKDGEPIADVDIERVSQRGLNGRQVSDALIYAFSWYWS
jgi:hypothetical protein